MPPTSPATEWDRCHEVPREGFPRPMPIFSLSLSLAAIEMEVGEMYDRFQAVKEAFRLYYMMPYFLLSIPGNLVYYAFSFSFWFWLFTFTYEFLFDPLREIQVEKAGLPLL